MRILFVNPYYKPYLGGIERVIEKLQEQFNKDGAVEAVGILTSYANFSTEQQMPLPSYENTVGLEIYRLKFIPFKIPFLAASPGAGFYSKDIGNVLDQFKPDVIQLMSNRWWPVHYLVWRKYQKQAKVFYSLSFHDLNLSFPAILFKIPHLVINRLLTNSVNKTIVVTKLEKEKIRSVYKTKESNITVVPWGIDQPKILNKIPHREVIILSVGRIAHHKGTDALVEAYLKAKKSFNCESKLLLVGEDQGLWKKIAERVEKLGLEKEIVYLGEATESKLKELYQTCDIFALIPNYESFGLVYLEAASYGIPLIGWKVGGLVEVFGEAALLSPYGDLDLVAKNLVLLVNSVFTRQIWSKKAKTLSEMYSWEETASKFLSLYKK